MAEENEHEAVVSAWMGRVAPGRSAVQLVDLLDRAFGAMWERAHLPLGEITLAAIVDRVLYNAVETHAFLSVLKVEPSGLRCVELRESAAAVSDHQLAEGIRFILVEFLTVLGSLTAEILTPALHAKLSSIAPDEVRRESDDAQVGVGTPASKDREDES